MNRAGAIEFESLCMIEIKICEMKKTDSKLTKSNGLQCCSIAKRTTSRKPSQAKERARTHGTKYGITTTKSRKRTEGAASVISICIIISFFCFCSVLTWCIKCLNLCANGPAFALKLPVFSCVRLWTMGLLDCKAPTLHNTHTLARSSHTIWKNVKFKWIVTIARVSYKCKFRTNGNNSAEPNWSENYANVTRIRSFILMISCCKSEHIFQNF